MCQTEPFAAPSWNVAYGGKAQTAAVQAGSTIRDAAVETGKQVSDAAAKTYAQGSSDGAIRRDFVTRSLNTLHDLLRRGTVEKVGQGRGVRWTLTPREPSLDLKHSKNRRAERFMSFAPPGE